MKKVLKKAISVALALIMVIVGISYSNSKEIPAATTMDEWKANAVITPDEGSLIGAGYINIKIDTSLEDAKSYSVYFDDANTGKLVDGSDAVMTFDASKETQICEVYSVAVKKAHTAYVVATMSDDSTVKSEIRTFYISKKGVAMGGDMSETVKLKKLNISWYYNWAPEAFNSSVDAGVAHVPMVWGGSQENIRDIKKITDESNYILGFNEPDIPSQANMSAGKSLAIWPYIEATGKRTVSPALAVYTGGYMDKFLIDGDTYDPAEEETTAAEDETGDESTTEEEEEVIELEGGYYAAVDVDAVALHRYGGSKTGVLPSVEYLTSAIDYLWNKYHKPIWVTEVSITGKKGAYSDWSYEQPNALPLMKEYVANIIAAMDEDDRVERYAWFPYNVESDNEIDGLDGCGTTALFDYESGKFTELGVMYSEMGNPEGYNPEVIAEDEKYVWEKTTDKVESTTERVVEKTTQNPATTQKPVTTKKQEVVAKPARVSISSAKNKKKKSVTVTWKKVKNAKKYQIQYSLNKKFGKAKKYKTKTLTTNKLKYSVKKLTKKKVYFFRVRAINGKKIGAWSKVKKVKIKK